MNEFSTPLFEADVRREGEAVVIAVSGELDLSSAEKLAGHIESAQASDAERVVVDLGNLSFIDSTGLHVLFKANTAAREGSHRLSFRRGGPQVRRVMEISGIDGQLEFLD